VAKNVCVVDFHWEFPHVEAYHADQIRLRLLVGEGLFVLLRMANNTFVVTVGLAFGIREIARGGRPKNEQQRH
jgi:hypothetical protein